MLHLASPSPMISPPCPTQAVPPKSYYFRTERKASSIPLTEGRNNALRLALESTKLPRKRSTSTMASSSSSSLCAEDSPWQFPRLTNAGKKLMEETVKLISEELAASLNPTCTPADVRSFRNEQGTGEGSIIIRSGNSGSKIDFVLGSWLHCVLPFGTLNIATIVGMANQKTDAPHLLFEFIQTGANSLVLVLDLLPRKDLVLNPEYLKRFYEDTLLESVKQELQKSPQAQRYEPPTLYTRCLTSPTSIMYKFDGQVASMEGGLDEIIEEVVMPAAKNVVQVWLEGIITKGNEVNEQDRLLLLERDNMIKTKGVEVDLSSNMPRLFGQEIANRVVEAFRQGK